MRVFVLSIVALAACGPGVSPEETPLLEGPDGGSSAHQPSAEEEQGSNQPDPATCEPGEQETAGCSDGVGARSRICASGQWEPWGPCISTDACTAVDLGEIEVTVTECEPGWSSQRSCVRKGDEHNWTAWTGCQPPDSSLWDVIIIRAEIAPLRWDGDEWDLFDDPDVYAHAIAGEGYWLIGELLGDYMDDTTPKVESFGPRFDDYVVLEAVPASLLKQRFALQLWDSDIVGRDAILEVPDGLDASAPIDWTGAAVRYQAPEQSQYVGNALVYRVRPSSAE